MARPCVIFREISRRRSRDTTSPRRCERHFFSNVLDIPRLGRNESADRVHILLAFGVELPGNLVRQWGDVGDSAAGDLLAELGKPQFGALADHPRKNPSASPTVAIWSLLSRKRQK